MYYEPAFVMCPRGQSACQPPPGLSPPTHINCEPWKVQASFEFGLGKVRFEGPHVWPPSRAQLHEQKSPNPVLFLLVNSQWAEFRSCNNRML